ncbi:ABC transporter ATP-binding protein [Tumebacillus lipolyticus]|uniref:ABC transporter ATP-binding protein n=1 Tax=Tumebacillus lipolyticus TaxID=1280370 RepID=A0ABW5A2G1_9BACL
MSEQAFISVDNICKSYQLGTREVNVLQNVSFQIAKGDRVALLGPSGSGKTTLLNMLGMIDFPSEGSIQMESLSPSARPKELQSFRRNFVSYVYQQYHLLPQFSALDNVCLPLVPIKVSFNLRERAKQLLERVGLGERIDHLPSELSGGEQQRVAIARALITSPRLLLCDEPTGNLDTSTRDSILDLLIQINQEDQTTLIIATHDPEVAKVCHRSIHIRDGQIDAHVTS